jgi:hypothetical protein
MTADDDDAVLATLIRSRSLASQSASRREDVGDVAGRATFAVAIRCRQEVTRITRSVISLRFSYGDVASADPGDNAAGIAAETGAVTAAVATTATVTASNANNANVTDPDVATTATATATVTTTTTTFTATAMT